MRRKFSVYGIYLPVLLFVFIPVVVMQSVAYISNPDIAKNTANVTVFTGYFKDTVLPDITAWIVTFASIFLLTFAFVAPKSTKLIPSFASPLNYIPCAISGAALFFMSAHLFTATSFGAEATVMSKLAPIAAILALVGTAYFVASAIYVRRRSIGRSDFGILLLVFLCAYVAYMFFDSETPINSPVKIANQMAYLSVAIFFLYETRLSLDREKWRPYIAFTMIAVLLTGYASIPALLAYVIRGYVYGLSVYETVLTFSFFVYTAFKLVLNGALVPEHGSRVVKALIDYAEARESELAASADEKTEPAEGEDENQMSIADIDVESELIDAPTVEEGFLIEQETLPFDDEMPKPSKMTEEDGFIPYEETAEQEQNAEEDIIINEENTGN